MPTYTYIHTDKPNGKTFEAIQKIADLPLTACPECNKPCKRIPSRPNLLGKSKSDAGARAKALGFKQLKRQAKGEYKEI